MTPVAQNLESSPHHSSMNSAFHLINGGGGDSNGGPSTTLGVGVIPTSTSPGDGSPSTTNGPNGPLQQQSSNTPTTVPPTKQDPTQKDELANIQENYLPPSTDVPLQGPNELFFGADRSSGLSYKDREDRVRQLRERQQLERHQKLEELKEQAAAAQKFREQQEAARRQRLDELRNKDSERRTQVEERKRVIQQAEQERREAVLRKSAEREQRLDLKRRQERSNAVFAFGSSTPRMLDPKENVANYWGPRKATSTTNVNLSDSSPTVRRSSECQDTSDLSRKRATSAHSLNRKPEDLRMSTSMYEVFNWDDGDSPSKPSIQSHASSQGTRLTKSRDSSLERRLPPQSLYPRSSTPEPFKASSSTHISPLSSSNSPEKPVTASAQNGSRFSVWEFGDNFAALGPASQGVKVGSGTPISTPLNASTTPFPLHFATAPTTPSSTPHYSRRTASILTGAGSAFGGEDPMTRSLIAPTPPPTAARRRTDLLPAFPSLRDATTARGSPRHRSPGFRSGTITPGSPSRPTSALSQASGGSQVSMRSRTSPKKPRPLSIAGSTLSSADKPRDSISSSAASPASPNRESRSIERKSSAGIISTKPLRAKSVGSDNSAPSTPAKTPFRGTTPKRTPAQVKAESNAKRASERLKNTPKSRTLPKTTPLSSPSVESKTLPSYDKKNVTEGILSVDSKTEESKCLSDSEKNIKPEELPSSEALPNSEPSEMVLKLEEKKGEEESGEIETEEKVSNVETKEVTLLEKEDPVLSISEENRCLETQKEPTEEEAQSQENKILQTQPDEKDQMQLEEKTQPQPATEKPVTGYATEEEYKAALAEKRRQAREAKERELELERQKKLEEEERERREEEEYLKLMEEQKKAEEERLQKAIEEAEKQRLEEAIKKEEEEKLRIEAEKIEQQKKLEAEEKMRKEEEERQMRKSRVAAIMSRTRGKGGGSTPSKAESKTPSDENKNLNDSLMSASMTEAIINNLSNSMTDSMIVQVIESQEAQNTSQDVSKIEEENAPADHLAQVPLSTAPCQAPVDSGSNQENVESLTDVASDISSQPLSDLSSQPLSDVSTQAASMVELSPQPYSDILIEPVSIESSTLSQDTQETVREMIEDLSKTSITETKTSDIISEDLNSSMEIMTVETRTNGNVFDPIDNTTTMQSMDLLGSFNGVNSINHNGMDKVSGRSDNQFGLFNPDNQFGSFDPFGTSSQQTISTDVKSETTFDQIIDLNQTKLSNEDAINSNNPPSPIIAFEDNLNKKQSQQNQDNSSNVPDLLL